MADVRAQAADILKIVPEPPAAIYSDGPTAGLFTKLTGTTQAQLLDNWKKGGILTCCNGFVGWYARELGSKTYLGRFDIEETLAKIGKSAAWVKSTADSRPKYGDICRHTAFHVGISLDFNGDNWNHVDAGQGGPRAGRDILTRTYSKTAYDFKHLQGWVDIEIFFAPAVPVGPVPDWLTGWWQVSWRRQVYYYYFDSRWQVKWTQTKPQDTSRPPLVASDTGTVTFEFPSQLTIRWIDSGNSEKYFKRPDDDAQIRGKWNDSEVIEAASMD